MKRRKDDQFAHDVIQWQRSHGRHTLPWQSHPDAYRIWLSEIMLQQTQVSTVIPYYQKFLTSFPDVFHLANASPDAVMAHWSGLGYYSRARNLHACAKRVVSEYAGVFPSQPALLADLPGIGRSTAAAIAAFAYGARAAILDGNVKRVFARVFGIEGSPTVRAVEEELWKHADALMPTGADNIRSYTQGLMDLGATICTRVNPLCSECPLQARCVALATQRVLELPTPKPKKMIPTKRVIMLVPIHEQHVLLQKRPMTGIWGGLFSLLELPFEIDLDVKLAARYHLRDVGEIQAVTALRTFVHTFSHFKLEINPYRCDLASRFTFAGENTFVWYDLNQCHNAPLPAPIKKILVGG
jgi:A/G-specific adenine glycosylase